jgi:nucleotide-binding universal stress UspA family protein
MKRFTNILVAFDGSPDSVLALEAAETLAKDNTAHLTVAYAHDDSPETVVYSDASDAKGDPNLYHSQAYIGPGTTPITPHSGQVNHKQVVVEDHKPDEVIFSAKSRISGTLGINYEILSGKPAAELIKYADKNKVDLIVIGNRGLSGIKKFFMGSVSQKVTNDAACAVFVMK